jgi:hypothetical protein
LYLGRIRRNLILEDEDVQIGTEAEEGESRERESGRGKSGKRRTEGKGDEGKPPS